MPGKTRNSLLLAMNRNKVKQFRKILKRKGLPKDSSWSDYELLVKALRLGRKRIAHIILDENARVTKNKAQLNSPLHIAASKTTTRWTKVIARLLSHGASIDDKNHDGDTALHVAFNCHATGEAIDLMLQAHLMRRTKVDVANKDGLTFLHIACARSDLNVVKVERLVDENNVNSQVFIESGKNYAGYTALHFAVNNFRYEIAELLIKHGANIDKQDCNGTTPLHLALRLRDVRIIDLLLAHDDQKRNIVDNCGVSHFMAACAGSNQSIAKAYLAESRSLIPLYNMISAQVVKAESCTGYTPLHFAVDLGQADTVEFLLDEGADCCGTTDDGVTPHVIAERRGCEDICKMLREHCDLVNMCMLMRSRDTDFGCWGDDYERSVMIDRVREIKQLQKTLKDFKSINAAFQPSALTITLD